MILKFLRISEEDEVGVAYVCNSLTIMISWAPYGQQQWQLNFLCERRDGL